MYDQIASIERDFDDVRDGTQWSTVYVFNGVLLILMCFNAILGSLGAFYYLARLLALVFNLLLTFVHLCAIITTCVFRFRALGKLCAISIHPTKKEDVSWTYENDAELIVILWSLQIVLLVPLFIAGNVPILRRKTKVNNDETELVNKGEAEQGHQIQKDQD